MRVGIMSMHRIHNYGSSLQAFGLRRMIEGTLPSAEVTFVDYRPGEVLVPELTVGGGRLGRVASKVLESARVRASLWDRLRFINHKRSYGRRYFPMLGIPANPVHDLDLDFQVIGSDEVFNCVQSNTNVGWSRDLFGHRSPARCVITYAASFGNTTLHKIESNGIRPQLTDDLSALDRVSVRDRNSADIVAALTGVEPEIHVDPVLAYDYMGEEASLIPCARQHGGPYIVVYGYSGRLSKAENAALGEYARSIGAKVLCFGGVQECCDEFVECDPFRLLAYFRDAEAVVTDTFHGTIFSMINRTPFATIVRPSRGHGYGNEEKLGYLLDVFGAADQRVGALDENLASVLRGPIDFDHIEAETIRQRHRAQDYLYRALNRTAD